MNDNQEELKKQHNPVQSDSPPESQDHRSVTQESQTRLIGTTTQQHQDSDDTFRRGSSLGSVMHDHQFLFQNKRSNLDAHSSSNTATPVDANRTERTHQPMLNTLGSGSGPISGLNQNHAKSKVTSLIRRKASDLEDEHDLQYSDSPNATTHYFQLESSNAQATQQIQGHQRKSLRHIESVVPEQQEDEQRLNSSMNQYGFPSPPKNKDQQAGVNSNFINEINQECSQLITNLNFNKVGESSFERESQESSVINKKRSIDSMDQLVKQNSSSKKEGLLGNSKSANLHREVVPKLPPIQKTQKSQASELSSNPTTHHIPTKRQDENDTLLRAHPAQEDDVLTHQNQINPSQKIIMNDISSEQEEIDRKTSTTHDLRNAMEKQFGSHPQPQILLNVNSDTDTHYNPNVNFTRDDITDHNPIFINHNASSDHHSNQSSKGKEIGIFGGRRSSEHQKILAEISPYLGNESHVPILSRPLASHHLANTNMTQSNRITFRMQQQDTQKSMDHDFDRQDHSSIMKDEDDEENDLSRGQGETIEVAANLLKEATHSSVFQLNGTHRRYEENNNHNGSTEGLINQDSENEETKRQDKANALQDELSQITKPTQYNDLRQSVHDLYPAQESQTYTDDAIYNRLPKNFFVQEAEEQFDLGEVMASIKQMRHDFVGYMNESKVQDKIEEINEMIYLQQPDKFIERQLKAMGLEGGESLLFEKVLANSPAPSNNFKSTISGHMEASTIRDAEPTYYQEANFGRSNEQLDVRTRQSNVTSKVQFCEPVSSMRRSIDDVISQKGNVEVIEEKLSRKEFEPFPNKLKEDQNFYATSAVQQEIPTAVRRQHHSQLPKQLAIKNLKMADYFRGEGTGQNIVISDREAEESPEKGNGKGDPDAKEELPKEIKEHLVDRLEQEILGNIDVNFLFHKGERLRFALIDQHRLYKIMLKIKEVAQQQVYERGSKQIDYTEIVQYLEEEDQYLTEGEKSKIHQMQTAHLHNCPTAEPKKTKIPQEEVLDDTKWIQVVDFMRKNPKLMLQMLPGDLLEDDQSSQAQNLNSQQPGGVGLTNLAQLQQAKAQEEQKRVQKLKSLSSKYTSNRRDFLEAIDRFQEKEFLLNSPKGNQLQAFGPVQGGGQKQKSVQVKSITVNQRKVRRAHQIQKDKTHGDEVQIGSEGEGYRNASNEPRQKQMIFEKQFSYTSANQAKGIYNAAPYTLAQPIFNDLGSGSENEQLRANENSQPRQQAQANNYQQHSMLDQLATKTNTSNMRKRQSVQSRKSNNPFKGGGDLNTTSGEVTNNNYTVKRLAGGHGGVASNLSNFENTTMTGGTTAHYPKHMRNNITNQIKTISQEDTQDDNNQGLISTTSMFTKFVKQPIMDAQPASRRPITANAAMGGFKHNNMRMMSDQQIYSQPSTTNIGLKSTNQMFRLPSASGMSSMSNQYTVKQEQPQSSGVEIPGGPKYNQQFPKFVTDKRLNWLNTNNHLREIVKQSEELNTSIKSNVMINSTAIIASQNDQEPPQVISTSNMGRRTKTQRVIHHQRRPQGHNIVPSIISDVDQMETSSAVYNSELLNRETSPQRKTQEFIEKIAPKIKHNELYPKFVNRVARRQTPVSMGSSQKDDQSDRNNSSMLVAGQNYEKDYHTAIEKIKQRKKSEAQVHRLPPPLSKKQIANYSLINQSIVSLKENGQDDQQSLKSGRAAVEGSQEQINLAGYPKFVKDQKKMGSNSGNNNLQKSLQRVSSSHSSQRVSSNGRIIPNIVYSDNDNNVGTEVARPVRASSSGYASAHEKVMVSQQMQTRLGGLGNKLLVSPKLGGIYGGEPENCAFEDYQYESGNDSEETIIQRRRLLANSKCMFPVVDWAFTPLFTRAINDDISFNVQNEMSLYEEKEVDYVIDMMKNKYKEFKRSDIMRPFYLKAQLTLKALLQEQAQEVHCERLMYKYKEVTIENTMKLLIRCKLNFHCRLSIFEILKLIISYELNAVQFKDIVGTYSRHKVDQPDVDKITEYGKRVTNSGHELLLKIKALRQIHKHFRKIPFIFKQRDYVNYVKNEMLEVRKLSSVFKVRTQQEIEEDEKNERDVEEKRLTTLLEKQKIIQLQQELEQMGVDFTKKEEEVREETEEFEEVEEIDPRSLLSPLRIVP